MAIHGFGDQQLREADGKEDESEEEPYEVKPKQPIERRQSERSTERERATERERQNERSNERRGGTWVFVGFGAGPIRRIWLTGTTGTQS